MSAGTRETIAIVGMAARMPGANDLHAFWQLLREGRHAIGELPEERKAGYAAYLPRLSADQQRAVQHGGFIDGLSDFDAAFFGISANEARALDPKQRLALEVAWHALEDAAIAPDRLAGSRTGVFLGTSVYDYFEQLLANDANVDGYLGTGNFNCVAANRVSYLLDLRGPSFAVETGCSSSLTALHLACRSLLDGSSDLALAGGVMTLLSPAVTTSFALGGFLAPDGLCKAFDDRADGYVRGEGAGMLVLKPLARALADGDRIWAVVEATALNQDGRSNGLTAPNPKAQEALLRDTLQRFGIAPERIDYIEAHGTGTRLGDPIEVKSIGAVFAGSRSRPLRIGSVKSNIGHLEAAAGIAGVIKTVLSLHHGEFVPTLHVERPNAMIPFEALKVEIQTERAPWPCGDDGRRWAGVNAFSFAGANAHVVLASAPPQEPPCALAGRPELLLLSAKTEDALLAQRHALADALNREPQPLAAVAHTLQRGRARLRQRAALLAGEGSEAADALRCGEDLVHGRAAARPPRVAWLFPGQGAQFAGMAQALHGSWPAFRDAFDRCAALIDPLLDVPLSALCWGEQVARLDDTRYTQPALFAVELALAQTMQSLALQPAAVLGHSVGEYAAAVIAGSLRLEDAARLVCRRAALIAELPPGTGMLAVMADERAIRNRIAAHGAPLHVCAVNGPDAVTIGGSEPALQEFATKLGEDGFTCRRLAVSHAFHTASMAPAQEAFAAALSGVDCVAPKLPMYSTLTGRAAASELAAPEYWQRQIGEPVRFADALDRLLASGSIDAVLEVGPGTVLSSLARRHPGATRLAGVWATLPRDADGWRSVLSALARGFVAGLNPDWQSLHGEQMQPLSLPGYPFQRERHWRRHTAEDRTHTGGAANGLLGSRLDLSVPMCIFANRWRLAEWPALDGHRVFERTILPGSATLTMLVGALRAERRTAVLNDVLWPAAQPLTADATIELQTVIDGDALSVRSRAGTDWTEIIRATLGAALPARLAVSHAMPAQLADPAATAAAVDLYRRLARRGLQYSGAFRATQAVLRIGTDVFARVGCPVDLPPALCPTVLLDAALHACAMFDDDDATPFVPWSLQAFEMADDAAGCCSVRWTLREEGSAERVLDGIAIAEDGRVLARWIGLHLRRANAALNTQESGVPALPADALFQCEWLRSDADTFGLPAELDLATAETPVPPSVAGYRSAIDALEAAVAAALPAVLCALGLPLDEQRRFDAGSVAAAADGMPTERARLLAHCLEAARARGLVQPGPGYEQLLVGPGLADVVARLQAAPMLAELAEARLLVRCLSALPELVAGRCTAVELLFQGEGTALLTEVYGGSPGAAESNRLLAQTVARWQAALPPSRRLRVLEVGAGTGATTAALVAALDMRRVDYLFTDVSSGFLASARARFAGLPGMRFGTLDLERIASVEALAASSFDVIVAANVVHATRQIGRSLTHLRRLLAPAGRLVLLEAVRPQLWLDLSFGLTAGWWAFEDRRVHGPLLDPEGWSRHLLAHGFEAPQAVGDHWQLHQQVLVARGSADARAGLSICRLSGGAESIRAALERQAPTHGWQVAGMAADTCGPAHESADALVLFADDSLDAGRECLRVLQCVQALVADGCRTRLLFVGSGGQSVLPHEATRSVASAAVLGLLRSVALEYPDMDVRALDLDPASDAPDDDAACIISALSAAEQESEIAWRAGHRHVPRLRSWRPASAHDGERCLRKRNGSLEQLSLQPTAPLTAGPGQLRIAVYWSGLNFLDLLDALDSLPFERPHGLGGECVGRIDALGPGVTGWHEGDWVMAITPGAMASSVLADVRTVVAIPPGLAPDRCVGLPVAYLTARRALQAACVVAGDVVLVHAAAGATGSALLQLARQCGARVLATASSAKQPAVRAAGAEAVFDSRSVDFEHAVRAHLDGGTVDVVVNSLTSPGFVEASLRCLGEHGRFVELAKNGILDPDAMAARRPDVRYVVLDLYREIAEQPEMVAEQLSGVVADVRRGALLPLPVELHAVDDAQTAFRRMQQGSHVGKLALSWRPQLTARQLGCDGDGTHLITGGFGGLGLQVAHWLAGHGARHLVLVGRRGPREADHAALDALRARGVTLELLRLDVTDRAALDRLCARFDVDLPALRSVYHAAGTLADALLAQQDATTLGSVLAPKLDAARHLAASTAGQPLAAFVLFASAAGVFGSAGQANHAAANAGLDALASQLRADGVPAVALDLGAVAEVGAAAAIGADRRVAAKGMQALMPAQFLRVLELAIGSGRTQLLAAPVRAAELDPVLRQRPMLSTLCPAAGSATVAEALAAPAPDWRRLPSEQRPDAVRDTVQRELSKVLGHGRGALDLQQGFTDLGIDSLGAVELRNRLQRELDLPLPSSVIFDHPNVEALVTYLLGRVAEETTAPTAPSTAEIARRLGDTLARLRNGVDA